MLWKWCQCYCGTPWCWHGNGASTPLILTSAFQSSHSESSISSPEHTAGSCTSQCAVGPCSPVSSGDSSELAVPANMVSYLQINCILKQAHFQSLQSRSRLRDTWQPDLFLCQPSEDQSPWRMSEHHMLIYFTQLFPPISSYCGISQFWISVARDQLLVSSGIWRGFIIQKNQSDNHFSNNSCVINLDVFLWFTWFLTRLSEPYCDWLMVNPCVLS